jgi:hypothetical protein
MTAATLSEVMHPFGLDAEIRAGLIQNQEGELRGHVVQRFFYLDRAKYYMISLMAFSVLTGLKMAYDCKGQKCSSLKMNSMIIIPSAGLTISFMALLVVFSIDYCRRN